MLWYLVHPYSNDPDKNFKLANKRTLALLNAGYNVFSPITYSHLLQQTEQHNYDFWMSFDEIILDKCDGLILAPNWHKSKGCIRELERAIRLNLPILDYKNLDLK